MQDSQERVIVQMIKSELAYSLSEQDRLTLQLVSPANQMTTVERPSQRSRLCLHVYGNSVLMHLQGKHANENMLFYFIAIDQRRKYRGGVDLRPLRPLSEGFPL